MPAYADAGRSTFLSRPSDIHVVKSLFLTGFTQLFKNSMRFSCGWPDQQRSAVSAIFKAVSSVMNNNKRKQPYS